MYQFKIPEPTEGPIKPSNCIRCGKVFYKKEGSNNEFCSSECEFMHKLETKELNRKQQKRAQERKREKEEQIKKREIEEQRDIIRTHCFHCDQARRKLDKLQLANYRGGMRGGATEITDNTLEKKLIDATAPYNEKAARNAENFAKASIEVGKAILDQLKLDPRTFIDKAKKLGIKITEITKEGIFLLLPSGNTMGKSVDKLIKSGTNLYFLPVRILGTIVITIFLSMLHVFIPLNLFKKIPGLKQLIDLIIEYTSIIPTILKNLKTPDLSFGSLIDSDVMDASYLRKGSKYEYKRSGSEGGGAKKRRTRRKKIGGMDRRDLARSSEYHFAPAISFVDRGYENPTTWVAVEGDYPRHIRPSDMGVYREYRTDQRAISRDNGNPKEKKENEIDVKKKLRADLEQVKARINKKKGGKKKRRTRCKKRRKN